MSSEVIDERIVEMSFDNKQFKQGIKETQKDLKEFDRQMQFDGAVSGINRFMSSFSKLDMMTASIINNLTNRVMNFTSRIVKSFTLDPITAGMSDYETKLTTMQTITNATGKTIKEVEVYFSDLDDYADRTIYNLTDMTSSMAKFVNAGVDLAKATPAIKGIANMTALAGQGAQQASIAMYNLSQSIAGGFLNRMDFKSLELANVATIEWKQNMADTAVAMGTLTKTTNGYKTATGKTFTTQQLFVDGLQQQWATTDVLLKVLGDYGDVTTDIGKKAQAAAQDVKSFAMLMDTLKEAVGTGWTGSFELIIGNLEESKALWTGVAQAAEAFLGTISDGRNTMLQFWHDNGGREAFLNGLKYSAIALIKALLAVSIAFDQIFPPMTQQAFVDMFVLFENFTKGMVMSEETADKVRRTFAGLFAIFDIGLTGLTTFMKIGLQIIKMVFPGFSGGLLDITATIGDFLVVINELINKGEGMNAVLKYTGPLLETIYRYGKMAVLGLIGLVSGLIDGSVTLADINGEIQKFISIGGNFIQMLIDGSGVTTAFAASIEDIGDGIGLTEEKTNLFTKGMEFAVGSIARFTDFASRTMVPVLGFIAKGLEQISLKNIGIILLGVGLIKMSKTLMQAIIPINTVIGSFSEVLDSTAGAIRGFSTGLKANALFTVAKSIAILSASLIALSLVPTDRLAIGLGVLTVLMVELTAAMLMLNKIKDPTKIGVQLSAISTGLYIVAKAAAQLSNLSVGDLVKSGGFIAVFLGIVTTLFTMSSKLGAGGKGTAGFISFSVGVIALSTSLLFLATVPFDKLATGTKSLSGILTVLTIFSAIVGKTDLTKSLGVIGSFSAGIMALTTSLLFLSLIPFEKLLKGSTALTAVLTIIALYGKMSKGTDLVKVTTGLTGFGFGLLSMTAALAALGNLDFATIINGTVALAGLLGVLAIFMKLTNGTELAVTAGSLIGLGVGIVALTGALSLLGVLDPNTLTQGGIAITGLMAAIAVFIKFTNGADLGVTAGGIIAFATGIGILSGVMAILTLLDTNALIQASLAIGGIIVAIGAFSKLTNIGSLAASAGGLLLFAVALAGLSIPIKMIAAIPWEQLLGVSAVIIAAVGMFLIVGTTMSLLAGVSAFVAPALVSVLGIGLVIAEIGALIAIFGALSKIPGAENLIKSGGDFLTTIGEAIGGFVGGIIGGVMAGATNSLGAVADNISAFGIGIIPFFDAIKGIDSTGIKSVKYLAEAMLILGGAALVDSLTSWLTGGNSLSTFSKELKAFAPDFVDFAETLNGTSVDSGLVEKVANATKIMGAMAANLPNQGNSVAKWFVGDNTLSVFATELKAFAPDFVDFAQTLSAGSIDADLIKKTANATKAMSALANGLPNQGNSVAKWFVGDNTLSTFAAELKAFAPDFIDFVNTMGSSDVDMDIVKKTANAARALATLANDLPNQGGMASWFAGDNTLSKFAKELKAFAPDFVDFSKEFGTVTPESIEPGIKALNELVKSLNTTGKTAITNLSKGFTDNKAASINVITRVLQDVVKSVSKYENSLESSGQNIVKGLIRGMKDEKKNVVKATIEVMSNSIKETLAKAMDMHSPAREMVESGKNIVQGLINGVVSKKNELVNSVKSMVGETKEAASPSSMTEGLQAMLDKIMESFEKTGESSGDNFAKGFDSSGFGSTLSDAEAKTKKAKTAFQKFKEWLEDEKFYGRMTTEQEIIEWEKQVKLYKKGSEERREIDKKIFSLRNQLVEETYQNEIKAMEKLKFYGKLSTAEEIARLEKLRTEYKKGSTQREEIDRNLYTLRKQLINETYQEEMDKISKLNDYGQLSLVEELARYRELAKAYKKGTDEREKIDLQIFNLEKKIYETRKQYIEDVRKTQADADAERLDAQNTYNQTVAKAQEDANKSQTKAYKKYNETMQKAEEEAYSKRLDAQKKYDESVQKAIDKEANTRLKLEQELADDILNIHDQLVQDIEEADQRYADALKSRADTIYGYYNLFDSVSERTVTTPEELLKNLSDQNAAIEDWRYSLQQLEARGISDQLLKELEQLGVSSSGQLSAMLAMTDEQLAEFAAMFERKHDLANTQAVSELVEYRKEIDDEIDALYAMADADIEARIDLFNEMLNEANDLLNSELNEAHSILTEALTDINTTLDIKTSEAQATLNETLTEINTTLQEKMTEAQNTMRDSLARIQSNTEQQLKSLKTSFDTTMESIHDKTTAEYKKMNKELESELKTLNTTTETKMSEVSKTMDTKSSEAATKFSANISTGTEEAENTITEFKDNISWVLNEFKQNMVSAGFEGARGLSEGLRAGEYLVINASKILANSALSTVKSTLDIHSPSKELESLGAFGSEGFANGIISRLKLVIDSAKSIGSSMYDILKDSITNLSNLPENTLSISPVITPIMDTSNIHPIKDLLGNGASYTLANKVVRRDFNDTNQNGSGSQDSGGTEVHNHFKIEQLVVREEADVRKIAREFKNMSDTTLRGRGERNRPR